MKEQGTKIGFGAITAVFSYMAKCFSEMVVILILLMLGDYVMGIISKWYIGQKFDKDMAIKGLVKKLTYLGFVFIGFTLDFCFAYLNYANTNGSIGLMVIFYLVGTELWSLLKHFGRMGLKVPKFVQDAVGAISKNQDGKGGDING